MMRILQRVLVLLLPALVLGGILGGCAKHDEARCQAVCGRGVTLAKQAVKAQLGEDADAKVVAKALATWNEGERALQALKDGCVERCVRDPDPSLVSCLEAAKSLQAYEGCLK